MLVTGFRRSGTKFDRPMISMARENQLAAISSATLTDVIGDQTIAYRLQAPILSKIPRPMKAHNLHSTTANSDTANTDQLAARISAAGLFLALPLIGALGLAFVWRRN